MRDMAMASKTCQVPESIFNSVMGYSIMELMTQGKAKGALMLDSDVIPMEPGMVNTDKAFYVALGQRIAERRKALGLTQQQLAETLGIAQQTLAHYEVGRLRVAAALLPVVSQAIGLSIEELLGTASRHSKRGPAPRLQAQMERISALPRNQQRMLLNMIDGAILSASSQAA